jgi:hypothetical protein
MIGSGAREKRLARDFAAEHVNVVLWPQGQLTANLAWYLTSQHFHEAKRGERWAVWIR